MNRPVIGYQDFEDDEFEREMRDIRDGMYSPDFIDRYNPPTNFSPSPDYIAESQGIEPDLLDRVVNVESGWNNDARGSLDEIGFGQLRPVTAKDLDVDPFSGVQNLYGTAAYLDDMIDANDGDVRAGLASYNGGLGRFQKSGYIPATEAYADKVLGSPLRDVPSFTSPSKYADVEIKSSKMPSFRPGASSRRSEDLSRVTQEITALEDQKRAALDGMSSQGRLDPDEAIAMALTAIIPALLGAGFGGLQGASMGAQAGLSGASVGLQGLTAEMNRRDNTNKLLYEDARQRLTSKEAEQKSIRDAINDADERGQYLQYQQEMMNERAKAAAAGRAKPPVPEAVIEEIAKRTGQSPDTVRAFSQMDPYQMQNMMYALGANTKPVAESQIDKIAAAESSKASIDTARNLALQFSPGILSALRAGKVTGWYSNPESPEYKFYAQVAKLKKEVARMNDSGALSQADVDMFAPLTEGSPVWDSQEAILERMDALETYIDRKRQTTLAANKAAGRNVSGFEQPIANTGSGLEAQIQSQLPAGAKIKAIRKKS